MSKFKVGDIVTATAFSPYSITNSLAIMEVLSVDGGIRVEIVAHTTQPQHIDCVFRLDEDFLEISTRKFVRKVKYKDVVF